MFRESTSCIVVALNWPHAGFTTILGVAKQAYNAALQSVRSPNQRLVIPPSLHQSSPMAVSKSQAAVKPSLSPHSALTQPSLSASICRWLVQ